MTVSVRGVLSLLAVAFAAYLSVRGLIWVGGSVDQPALLLAMVVGYLLTVVLCIFIESGPAAPGDSVGPSADDELPTATGRGPSPLPMWLSLVAVTAAVAIPNAVSLAAAPGSQLAPFVTWYIGAIGLLMTIVMIRRRPWVAWAGTAVLTATSTVWLGLLPALSRGLVGSVMWVLAAQLLMLSMDRAAHDTARLSALQRTASAWRAAQLSRQRERRVVVRRALAVAGPILTRAIEVDAALSDAERGEARIAEGTLRDELRGSRLLDGAVRAQLEAARRRGAVVSVVDEGGLDGLDATQLEGVRAELAAVVAGSKSQRLYIRSSAHPEIAVTVVGRSGEGAASADEDAVDLWHEIPRPDVPHRPGGGGVPGR